MLSIFKKVWNIYKPLRPAIVWILILLIVSSALNLAWPLFYGRIIDFVIAKSPLNNILILLAMALAVMLVQNVVALIKSRFELKHFNYAVSALAQKVTLKKLFTLSIGQHRNENSGLTQSVIADGQAAIQDILNMAIYEFFPFVLRIVIALIGLLFLSWQVGLVVILGLILDFTIGYFVNKKFIPSARSEREMSQELGKKRSEVLRNAPLIISNSAESYTQDFIEHETSARDNFAISFWYKYLYSAYLIRPSIADITQVLSIIFAVILVAHGALKTGQVVTLFAWSSAVVNGLGMVSSMQRRILFASERANKYLQLLNLTSDVSAPEKPVEINNLKGEIVFKGVSFIYSKKRIIEPAPTDKKKKESHKKDVEAINNISLEIHSNEHVAFVGSSGAGKSTMALLLLRGSDPQKGGIYVDGINLKDIDINFYRQNVGIVEQHIILFDDTIRRNISFGVKGDRLLSDEELDHLAKIARLDEFKDKLVDGWDTVIGENGIKLSGGQRQRVGIARALAKNPAILILDEATSSLDAKNEALIKEALADASRGRTTITVAHRLSTIKDADRIFVFDKGTIVGVGTHEELLKTCPTYADLVSHQTVLL